MNSHARPFPDGRPPETLAEASQRGLCQETSRNADATVSRQSTSSRDAIHGLAVKRVPE